MRQPPITIFYADLLAAREAGDSWPTIRARYGGVCLTTLRSIWTAKADRTVFPRVRRSTGRPSVAPPARSLPSPPALAPALHAVEETTRAFALQIARLGVKRLDLAVAGGSVSIVRLET